MKLTRASTYALQAIAYMAVQKNDDVIPSHIIAQKKGIPERFLLKVLKPLVSAEVLHSVKGPRGGYRLVKSVEDITVLEVIEAVDGPIRGHSPLGGRRENANPINKKLDTVCSQAADQARKVLGKVKISDLL